VVASAKTALEKTATMRGKDLFAAMAIDAIRDEIAHYCGLGDRKLSFFQCQIESCLVRPGRSNRGKSSAESLKVKGSCDWITPKQTECGGTIGPMRTDDDLGATAEWYLTIRVP
jgi:hypothetical protein